MAVIFARLAIVVATLRIQPTGLSDGGSSHQRDQDSSQKRFHRQPPMNAFLASGDFYNLKASRSINQL
jgi:hypothetical protein